MKRPRIKTTFVIMWDTFHNEEVNDDAQVRRRIYHKGIRSKEYRVEEIDRNGQLQSIYIYKYTSEGPIFRKQLYSLWKEKIREAKKAQLEFNLSFTSLQE